MMFARLLLPVVAGCLLLAGSSVTANIISLRGRQTSSASCSKTIISNNADSTKFSFDVNYPAVRVTHCQPEAEESESWGIEPLNSDDTDQPLNIDVRSKQKYGGKGLSNTNEDWERKMDVLLETVVKLEKRIEQIITTPKTLGGYKKIGNLSGMYKMHSVGMTWIQAKSMCEQEGSHLLVINSAEERNVVPSLFSQTSNIQCADWNDWAWIGVHDSMTEGDFYTVTGERLSSIGYAYWIGGRPISSSSENCVAVDMKGGAMYDSNCDKKAPFICEL